MITRGDNSGARTFGGAGRSGESGERYGDERRYDNPLAAAMRLAQNIAANTRTSGHNSDPNEGFKSFSYNKGKNEGLFGGMFDNNDVLSDEQFKIEAIDQACRQAATLYQYLHNRTQPMYSAVKDAMETFRRDSNGGIEQVFDMYINEVETNMQMYRYLASNCVVLFASELVTMVVSSTLGDLNTNSKRQLGLLSTCFFNMLCLQFTSWLEYHPQGFELLGSLSPKARNKVQIIDNNIEVIQNKFLNITVGSVNYPFPWKKGFMRRMTERTQVKSNVLEGYEMPARAGGSMMNGLLSEYDGKTAAAPSGRQFDIFDELARANSNNPLIKPADPFAHANGYHQHRGVWDNGVDDSEDVITSLKKMNYGNRMEYNMLDYFVPVYGSKEEMYVIDPEHFRLISRWLELDFSSTIAFVPYRNVYIEDTIPVVWIDWEKGLYEYTNVPLKGKTVKTILTDPNQVLPLLADSREIADLSSYNSYLKETTYMTKVDDEPINIEECKKLKEPPKVLYGNKPMEVTTNEEIPNALATLSNYYDPNDELDGFSLPFSAKKMFQMDNGCYPDDVYESYPNLVMGRCEAKDMNEFILNIKQGMLAAPIKEFTDLITYHLTNVVNRWLVECRFYPEDKESDCYLRVENIISEHREFVDFLKANDPETLKSYMDLENNEFLKENFTIIATPEDREKFINHELSKYQDDLLLLRTQQCKNALVLARDFFLTRINTMKPISGYKKVVVKSSAHPELEAMYEEALKKMDKRFSRPVPFLVTFGEDNYGRIWVATKSEFDNGVYTFRPINTSTNIQLLSINK